MEAVLFNIQKFCLHDGPGIRTTVFFKGCNLRCRWCANPESQSRRLRPDLGEKLQGRVWTLEEVLEEALQDKAFYDHSGGGVTMSGGEPLLQADFACALCDALHEHGIQVSIETAASVPEEIFRRVFSRLDTAHIDLKHWDEEKHRRGTGVGMEHILRNISIALEGTIPVFLRIPVIPGFNDSAEDAAAFAALLHKLGTDRVQLLPFHQMGEKKYEEMQLDYELRGVDQLHEEDLEAYADIMRQAGIQVQIGG